MYPQVTQFETPRAAAATGASAPSRARLALGSARAAQEPAPALRRRVRTSGASLPLELIRSHLDKEVRCDISCGSRRGEMNSVKLVRERVRSCSVLAAAVAVVAVAASTAAGGPYSASTPAVISGLSPFSSCDFGALQQRCLHELGSGAVARDRFGQRQPGGHLAARSLVGRERPRARHCRLVRWRCELGQLLPALVALRRRDSTRRRLPAGDRPLGELRSGRDRLATRTRIQLELPLPSGDSDHRLALT